MGKNDRERKGVDTRASDFAQGAWSHHLFCHGGLTAPFGLSTSECFLGLYLFISLFVCLLHFYPTFTPRHGVPKTEPLCVCPLLWNRGDLKEKKGLRLCKPGFFPNPPLLHSYALHNEEELDKKGLCSLKHFKKNPPWAFVHTHAIAPSWECGDEGGAGRWHKVASRGKF